MSVFDKFKDMIGIEDEYEYYDDYEDNDYQDKDASSVDDFESPLESERLVTKRSSIMNLQTPSPTSSDRVQINIHEPVAYEDSPAVLDSIIDHKAVVLNLELLDMDVKKQVFNFVSGGIYAVEGKIEKVTKDIFIIAPKAVEIDGKLKERIEGKGFYQY